MPYGHDPSLCTGCPALSVLNLFGNHTKLELCDMTVVLGEDLGVSKRTWDWRPLLFIVLGVGAVLASHFFLHTCQDHGHMVELANGATMPMRCHWSERAFQGVGALVAFAGLVLFFFPDAARGLSLAVAGAGLLMIIIPMWLVPTCAMPGMICNLSFKPGAYLTGGITVLSGLVGTLRLRRLDVAEGERSAV